MGEVGVRGRWMDNVMIERLWRSLKYECVYLQAFETGAQARAGIGSWIDYCNKSRPHSALVGRTPEEAYLNSSRHLRGMPRRWRQRRWRHENYHGIPPNKRRQAVQRLGSTSECINRWWVLAGRAKNH